MHSVVREPELLAKKFSRTSQRATSGLTSLGRWARQTVLYLSSNPKPVLGYWWRGTRNVGDLMGPYLLSRVLQRRVIHIDDLPYFRGRQEVVVSVGSIIQQINFPRPQIWGTGLIDPDRIPSLEDPTFYSVRGPLTREALLQEGYACPESYGDPGLLIARYYGEQDNGSSGTGISEIGLVLHYKDEAISDEFDVLDGISTISVKTGVDAFVSKVRACDVILSSSLHGIITAHSVGIPAVWLRRTQNKKGGAFKYLDYLLSYGSEVRYVDAGSPDAINRAVRQVDKYCLYPPPDSFIDNIAAAMPHATAQKE